MLYIRSNTYWCKFKHRGRVHRLTTGVRVESAGAPRAAAAQEQRLRAQAVLDEGPGRSSASDVTLAALEELHVEHLENRGAAELRVSTVRNLWRHLERHLGEHRDVMTLELRDLDAYEGARRRDGARGQTIRRERQALRRALRLAKRDGLIPMMPLDFDDAERIKSDPKRKSQAAKLWPIETIDAVLEALSSKARAAGHIELCRFVMMTGLRSTELARASAFEVTRLRRGGTAVALLEVPDDGAKTAEARTLPLSREALVIFNRWRHRFAVADVAHALTRASRKVGLEPGVTLRDMRKFYLSHAARSDLAAAQKLAGHEGPFEGGVDVARGGGDGRVAGAAVTALAKGGHSRGHSQSSNSKKPSNFRGARSSVG